MAKTKVSLDGTGATIAALPSQEKHPRDAACTALAAGL
jgi:hypothetical protein